MSPAGFPFTYWRFTEGSGTSVADIAEAIGKSVRSVRSKLVREKDENGERVYIPAEKPVSNKVTGPSKKVLLNDLEKLDPNFPVNGMKGATKEAIEYLVAGLKG